MVSMVVLLVVAGAAFSAMDGLSKNYGSTTLRSDMSSGVRSAAELMTQEVGQAGSLPITPHQLTAPVTGSAVTPQTVFVDSTAGMFVGQILMVDAGATQEQVQIQAIPSTISLTGIFANSHAKNAPVDASGVLPQGILSTSTPTQLELIGDINGDGTLVYVEYDCNPNAAGTGTLTRSITLLPAAAKNPSTVLLQNLVTNPGGLGNTCFTIPAATAAAGFNFVPSLGVSLTVQSSARDPQSGAFQTLTKSFMNLAPRNVLVGLDLAQSGVLTNRLQPTPPGVPLS